MRQVLLSLRGVLDFSSDNLVVPLLVLSPHLVAVREVFDEYPALLIPLSSFQSTRQ
jgi:hypothetical protein